MMRRHFATCRSPDRPSAHTSPVERERLGERRCGDASPSLSGWNVMRTRRERVGKQHGKCCGNDLHVSPELKCSRLIQRRRNHWIRPARRSPIIVRVGSSASSRVGHAVAGKVWTWTSTPECFLRMSPARFSSSTFHVRTQSSRPPRSSCSCR